MNKKGSFIIAKEMMVWIPRIIFLIVVLVAVLFVVTSGTHKITDIYEIKQNSIITNLFYSDNCLAYEDIRINPGIIDINKLNLVEKCMSNEKTAFNLTIQNLEENKLYFAINNPDLYEVGSELCFVPGKYLCKSEQGYLLINDGEKLTKAKFKLESVFEK